MSSRSTRDIGRSVLVPGPIGWLVAMADAGIPDKLLPAVRLAVFWIGLPFIGLLLGGEELHTGSYYWATGWLACALLSIAVAVYWDRIFSFASRTKPARNLEYLSREDAELGPAIAMMGWRSAWGKWYAAQALANSPHGNPKDHEQAVMHVAATHVWDALLDGRLSARGRKRGQMDFEVIPQTHWRSSPVHMIRDNASLWRMILIPTGGAEFTPDGTVIGHDPAATQRTDQLAAYDSFIVNSWQFESLWPLHDRNTDKARKRLLRTARKAGAMLPAEQRRSFTGRQ